MTYAGSPVEHRIGVAAPRIATVEALIVAGAKDYVADAGLRPVQERGQVVPRPLGAIGDLHVCAYPPRMQTLLVRIVTEDGIAGWGEGHAPMGPAATRAVVEEILAPLVVGENPLAIERHWERMYGSMRLRGHRAGYHLEAMSAVDIALWDLAGKILGQPVYRLLGGPFQTTVPVYASGIPGRTAADRAASARRLIDNGYTTLKVSIGRGAIDADVAAVADLVKAIDGRADLLVDAHGAYSADNALRVGRALQDLGVRWLEDPLPPEDLDGYGRLATQLDLPIATGETACTRWDIAELLRRGAADVLLPDVCRAGGISEGRKIAMVASLHNTRWAAHVSMGSAIHLAAAAHLAAATANCLLVEFPSAPNPLGDPILAAPFGPERGIISLPEAPGLGITFDEARLAAHVVPHVGKELDL